MPAAPSETNLENMTDGQLQELLAAVKQAISERVQSRISELQSLANAAGFDVRLQRVGQEGALAKLGREVSRRQIVVAAKYRNPENPSETWSGRGHQPRWVQTQLASGRTLADLTIK